MPNGSMRGCRYLHHTYNGYCGPGFIYIATDGEVYKIGCTKEESSARHVYKSAGALASVVSRLHDLNKNKRGRKFRILHVIYSPVCVRGLEKILHGLFAEKRIGKEEWFFLSESDYVFLCSIDTFDGHELIHLGTKP